MFEKKKLWMVLATTAFLAACGGSSGGGGGDDGGAGGGGGGGNSPDPIVSDDTSLNGYILMESNNHLLFNENFQTLAAFQDGGVYGNAKAANGAPLQAFGFRIMDVVQGDDTADDEAVGRIGITLTEREGSAVAPEVAETMQIIVNGVRLSTDAAGVVSANLTDGATMIVAGRTANGTAIAPITISGVPSTALDVVPGEAGTGSSTLVLDLEEAFGAATGTDVATLAQFGALSGRFDMDVTLSAAEIRTAPGGEDNVLTGEDIAVPGSSTVAPVSGSGVSGNIWIEVTP